MYDAKIYAKTVFVEGLGGDSIEVYLHGIDLADLISEVGYKNFLNEMDLPDIKADVNEREAEEAEDAKDD